MKSQLLLNIKKENLHTRDSIEQFTSSRLQNLSTYHGHLEQIPDGVAIQRAAVPARGLVRSLAGQPLLLVAVDDLLAGPEIRLLWADLLGLEPDLVARDHD